MSRLVNLYPSGWRSRYEEEFLAVLASRQPTARDRIDIVRGAIDARLHPQVAGPMRVPDRSGYLVFVGLVLYGLALFLAATGPEHRDEYGTYRDGAAALPFFAGAFALLSVGIFRILDRLPADAAWSRVAGYTAMFAGPLWATAPWVVPIGLIALAGLVGLAVGARRAGLMPTIGLVTLVAALSIPAGLMIATLFLPWYAMRVADIDGTVIVLSLGLIWVVVGATLLRGFPVTEAKVSART